MADRIDLPADRDFLVIGDVHGHAALLDRLLAYAADAGLFAVSVGDLVDRGPDSAGCLERFMRLEAEGEGVWLRGNHEDKVYRALLGRPVKMGEAVVRTLDELAAAPEVRAWFLNGYPWTPFAARFGPVTIAHGGFAPAMLKSDAFSTSTRVRALYGQADTALRPDGKPQRRYDWVEAIPPGHTVLIGHDPISRGTLFTRANDCGGHVVHLDSNAAKGGPLSGLVVARDGRIGRALQARPETAGLIPADLVPLNPPRAARRAISGAHP